MSPEMAMARPTDERSDLYSLGCVLFEMLTGCRPFEGNSYYEVMAKHINAPLPPIVSPHGHVPEIVERIVRRAMAKRVEERYQAAHEMAADLARAAVILGREGWRRWLPT
jgi:serine/threonine-protein kinase